MLVKKSRGHSATRAQAIREASRARTARITPVRTEEGVKFSSGVAAVGAAAGALAGFLTPLPGATAVGAALGGMLGKIGGEKFD